MFLTTNRSFFVRRRGLVAPRGSEVTPKRRLRRYSSSGTVDRLLTRRQKIE